MQGAQRIERGRAAETGEIGLVVGIKLGDDQSLLDQRPNARLGDAGRQAIDRRQPRFRRQLVCGVGDAILGMDDFRAAWRDADSAERTQPAAIGHRCFLRLVEVEEAQHQTGAAIVDHHAQPALGAEADLGGHDPAADQRFDAVGHIADRHDPAAILVADRQVQQQVADPLQTQRLEPGGDCRPSALQEGEFGIERQRRLRAGLGGPAAGFSHRGKAGPCRYQSMTITASASTRAPRGRLATPIAARAG